MNTSTISTIRQREATGPHVKLGIMQPYLFPYIGYFQLIHAVDVFVFYDDVAFIQQGWINRNRIRINGDAQYFTVPLADASSFRPIRETMIAPFPYDSFRKKFFKTITNLYRKAPFFRVTFDLLEKVFIPKPGNIAEIAGQSLSVVCNYLGITTRFISSSSIFNNAYLKKSDRLIDICHKQGADTYINAIGGLELYSKEEFASAGILLQFLRTATIEYPQDGPGAFLPNLSIIDVMMHNSRDTVRGFLDIYNLV